MHNKTPWGDFAREAIMTSEMTAFAIAVGGTSLVCYLLMTRLQNRCARSAPRDGFLPDCGNYTAAEGWIISSRLGSDNPAFDSSGNPSDPAGGDSGGGADGEAARGEVEVAINPSPAPTTRSVLVRRERGFRFIPICIGTSLESLQKGLFLFASVHHFQYR
jgi:hypothetical protein